MKLSLSLSLSLSSPTELSNQSINFFKRQHEQGSRLCCDPHPPFPLLLQRSEWFFQNLLNTPNVLSMKSRSKAEDRLPFSRMQIFQVDFQMIYATIGNEKVKFWKKYLEASIQVPVAKERGGRTTLSTTTTTTTTAHFKITRLSF